MLHFGKEELGGAERCSLISAPGCSAQRGNASGEFAQGCESLGEFTQAFEEAFTSALTKFDSVEVYFASGMTVPAVCKMLADEIHQDLDFIAVLQAGQYEADFQAMLRNAVGRANGRWKKAGGTTSKVSRKVAIKDIPLPWASIDAYPEWVVNQISNYADAEPGDQAGARRALEHALLERPLCAGTVKYDGTCFGKLDTGELVGRKQLLGIYCDEYQQTSTASAASCNVAALRDTLSELLSVSLSQVCVWGELMCNPGYYGYRERGLASKWLCFGVVAALDGPVDDQRLCRQLNSNGFAYSFNSSSGKLRLLCCPVLRQLLQTRAGCDAVDDLFPGHSHAEMVASAAAGLSKGTNEGIVVVFTRADGQASLRKWKNSSEGASARKNEVQLLSRCLELCSGLVAKGMLDTRIESMVSMLREVAAAETTPLKKGRKVLS